jgi:GNAT superfamily N-acetyltransferase
MTQSKAEEKAELTLREIREGDIVAMKVFCDRAIGVNYYSVAELEDILKRSCSANGVMCSFVLLRGDEVVGVRFTYPQDQWKKGKGQGLRTDLWKTEIKDVAYFQSLFLAPEIQGKGHGQKVSLASLEALKKAGAKAVVTHAWQESPNDSSRRYLAKLGFKLVAVHPRYWFDVDYECTRCGKPCVCTADEMIKYL